MSNYNDLEKILFSQIEKISKSELTGEELKDEISKANTIKDLSETFLKNSETKMKTILLAEKFGYVPQTNDIPKMLGVKVDTDEK